MKTKIEILGQRLKNVAKAFDVMKRYGIDEDLLIAYLCHNTKMSLRDVKEFLKTTEEFYTKLCKNEMLASLLKDVKEGEEGE